MAVVVARSYAMVLGFVVKCKSCICVRPFLLQSIWFLFISQKWLMVLKC